MTITVNGQKRDTKGSLLTDLLEEVGLTPATVAVEINGSLVRRSAFEETVLNDGDRIEIVRMVCGG